MFIINIHLFLCEREILMNEKTYEAVKFKFEQEKLTIEEEIASLQLKKDTVMTRKETEENKLRSSSNLLREKKVITAAILNQRFDYAFVKQCEREISLIDAYIEKCNTNLEAIKEQEKYINGIYLKRIKEKEYKERKREEETLVEYKKWLDFS